MEFRRVNTSLLTQIAKYHLSFAAVYNPAGTSPALHQRHFSGGRDDTRHLAFYQKRPAFQPALPPDRFPERLSGDELLDRMRALASPRIRLVELRAPPPEEEQARQIASREVRKLMRASHMEAARRRLRGAGESIVTYQEFVRLCCEAVGAEQGAEVGRWLDESGAVVVLGDVVFLRPDEIAKAIEKIIPLSLSHKSDSVLQEELREMEEKKADIDRTAAARVRRELWCGLGYLAVQTAAFMRLTFWELTWDVMEPICFYVTSLYCMAGYAFFLRTSREPSFEGFFQSRFAVKQERLMRSRGFDLHRLDELRRTLAHTPPPPPPPPQSEYANCGGGRGV